jgi:hypothetical protein
VIACHPLITDIRASVEPLMFHSVRAIGFREPFLALISLCINDIIFGMADRPVSINEAGLSVFVALK